MRIPMRVALPAAAVLLVAGGGFVALAATTSVSLNGGDVANVVCSGTSPSLSKSRVSVSEWNVKCHASTPTTTPPPVTPPPTNPPPGGYSCSAQIGGGCGAYDDPSIPMSNGYDTYISNQAINVHGSETVNANSPGDWDVVANLSDCGGCVQTFPDAQQLTNDWGNGGWGNCGSTCGDTPLSALSTLKINYSETSPTDAGSSYEFAPDIWDDNYGADVMFWVDTKGRCNEGAFGGTVLGNAVLDGQNWTVHRYGGPGAEIIFVLDGPGGSGTCAQQSSGTVDIKAGFDWLAANVPGFDPNVVFSQLNTGWEITQADNSTFTVTSYSITAN